MAVYNVGLYDADPYNILSRTLNGTAVWTGPSTADGTATITDNSTAPDQLTDGNRGEAATADVVVNGTTLTGTSVEAEEYWLLRDTVTGEQIKIATFNVGSGAGYYTLASAPLVEGRSYETLAYDASPETAQGTGFSYADYNDGIVSGTSGDDVIDRNYSGDPNGDKVDANDDMNTAKTEGLFQWSSYGDNADMSGGATQTVNGVSVTVTSSLPSGSTFVANREDNNSATTETLPTGLGYDPNSTARFFSDGNATNTTLTIDFDSTDTSTTSTEVHNVQFLITDIDGVNDGTNNFRDILTITAYDADGNLVPVTIEVLGNDSVSGQTVTGALDADESNQLDGAVRVTVGGPVERILVDYDNGGNTQQAVYFSDIRFDTVESQGNADSIEAGAGNDSVFAGSDDDTVRGGTGNDTIDGGGGNDLLFGDAGADSLIGGTGNDTLDGGTENDTLFGGAGSDSLLGGDGADSLSGGADGDVLRGGSGGDTLLGDGGNDSLFGDAGADSLVGGTGNDTLDGGTENDTLRGGAGSDSLLGGDGADQLFGGADGDTLRGGLGNDTIYGDAGNDSLEGGDGNDVLMDGEGNDTVDGGAGNDTLGDPADPLSSGADLLLGGSGNDSIYFGNNQDTAYGGDDADFLYGQGSLWGKEIAGGEGGDDRDTLSYALETDAADAASVTYTGDESGIAVLRGQDHVFREIETVQTTQVNDTVDATAATGGVDVEMLGGNDSFTGGAGADSVKGGTGSDTIAGGAGDDTLLGGDDADTFLVEDDFGNDVIVGGEGGTDDDVIDLTSLTAPVTVSWTADEAGTIFDGTSTLSFSEIERITFGSADESADASARSTGASYDMGGGDDSFSGSAQGDTVSGGEGADTISGGGGADVVSGGAGDDVLYAGEGDTVTGGDGDDLFLIDPDQAGGGSITLVGGEGAETGGDTLDLNGMWDSGSLVLTNSDDSAGGLSGSVRLTDGTTVYFSEMEQVICFAPGTRIATPHGPRPVDSLVEGDAVLTRDAGPQPLRWIGRTNVVADAAQAPVRFAPGTVGNARTLRVSPQHRMVVRGWRAQLLFGEDEVLVPALALVDGRGVVQEAPGPITYRHLLCDAHQIIFAEGAETETFLPAAYGLGGVDDAERDRLFALRPELRADLSAYGPAARPVPRTQLARLLAA